MTFLNPGRLEGAAIDKHRNMEGNQSLASFIFPEMKESDLRAHVEASGSFSFERVLGKGRVTWSLLIKDRENSKRLLLMRLYAKTSHQSDPLKTKSPIPFFSSNLHVIQDLYENKCAKFDFIIKPILLRDSESLVTFVRPFSRYNLSDRIITYEIGSKFIFIL